MGKRKIVSSKYFDQNEVNTEQIEKIKSVDANNNESTVRRSKRIGKSNDALSSVKAATKKTKSKIVDPVKNSEDDHDDDEDDFEDAKKTRSKRNAKTNLKSQSKSKQTRKKVATKDHESDDYNDDSDEYNEDEEDNDDDSDDDFEIIRKSRNKKKKKASLTTQSKIKQTPKKEANKRKIDISKPVETKPKKAKTEDKKSSKIKTNDVKLITATANNVNDSNEESNDDWEEVSEQETNDTDDELKNHKANIPEEGLQITLQIGEQNKSKKNSKRTPEELLKLELNRLLKKKSKDIQKLTFLCSLAHGLFVNHLISNDNLLYARSISLLCGFNEHSKASKMKEMSKKFLEKFFDWYKSEFEFSNDSDTKKNVFNNIKYSLHHVLNKKQFHLPINELDCVLIFNCLLRALNSKFKVRLCFAFNAAEVPIKLDFSDVKKKENKIKSNESKCKQNRKALSEDDGDEDDFLIKKSKKNPNDPENPRRYWSEVYLDREKRWVTIDIVSGEIDQPENIEKISFSSLIYVFAFNNDNIVKEVTPRYSSKFFHPSSKRLRIEERWFERSLQPFSLNENLIGDYNKENEADEKEFAKLQSKQPFPNTVAEYKGNSLYALKRHLLKYEVIYPPDAKILGYFRNEAIYSRENVETVHSAIYWRRQGRTIIADEVPYKVGKARPKWDKFANKYIKDIPLDLFGYWQTEPFIPPTAVDGKVPRNEYGNVELFTDEMLPIGTVHLKLPGLLRIANKLGIDCVPAVVAFDSHCNGRGVHPVYEGFIVCEEFKETLIEAWDEEEEIARKREKEKRMKRVLNNWRRLTKGLLIREKLKRKYNDNDDVDSDATDIEEICNDE